MDVILLIELIVLLICIFIILYLIKNRKGELPKFLDENGNEIEESISKREYIEIDGDRIGMITLAKNKRNPLLLFCGGGPGIPGYLLEYIYPTKLTDKFIVCFLDYRGTGLSYNRKIKAKNMTAERYLDDVEKVTDFLCKEYDKEKIYILGHSFGSYVALNTVKRNPNKYYAYIAMSQLTKQNESEFRAYDFMRERYKELGNKKMVNKFKKLDIRNSETAYLRYFISLLRDKAMHDLGVGTTRDMKSIFRGLILPSMKCKAYSFDERINIWKGKLFSNCYSIIRDVIKFNSFEQVKNIDIPIYFLIGKYDYMCCYTLQQEYYESIKAPRKKMYMFESAHSPIFESTIEGEKAIDDILSECNEK